MQEQIDFLTSAVDHTIEGVALLGLAVIIGVLYQAYRNKKTREAEALAEARWQARMNRDAEVGLPPVEVRHFPSLDALLESHIVDTSVWRRMGHYEQASQDGRL